MNESLLKMINLSAEIKPPDKEAADRDMSSMNLMYRFSFA
ncbi:hypothetical protein BSMD_044310 [Bacillus subtilis Miyagi-4]|uniref:Uncharacterized protein n=1 Tax=Bacillus subtilis TaxID=1423 RepID=A0A0D1JE80_BACIU|nr:hypothetical protein SC09_Contig25orf00528 [Bacillus subtilis]GAK82463.1 hypothetical protein BSMD_044310 [Bacillus subtilis Miyagi-4]